MLQKFSKTLYVIKLQTVVILQMVFKIFFATQPDRLTQLKNE